MKVPKDVLIAIRNAATAHWDDDKEMVNYTIENEVNAYKSLQTIDFGLANSVRQDIIDAAFASEENWEDRLSIVKIEIEAFHELQRDFDHVPRKIVETLKAEAAQEYSGDYYSQRNHVADGIKEYLYIEQVRARIGRFVGLLIKMERVIGGECYNGRIQNYGPGGVWEGEGRSFRYPVKFLNQNRTEKEWTVPTNISPEVLITGHYQFGSNELNIFRALAQIIEMIEQDYGVRLADSDIKT